MTNLSSKMSMSSRHKCLSLSNDAREGGTMLDFLLNVKKAMRKDDHRAACLGLERLSTA